MSESRPVGRLYPFGELGSTSPKCWRKNGISLTPASPVSSVHSSCRFDARAETYQRCYRCLQNGQVYDRQFPPVHHTGPSNNVEYPPLTVTVEETTKGGEATHEERNLHGRLDLFRTSRHVGR